MSKSITIGDKYSRKIDLGSLHYLIDKYRFNDIEHVVYKLSYAGKYIVVKGKTLCGSLIIIADTLKSFNPDNERFKSHLYAHLYNHLLSAGKGRFRIKLIYSGDENGLYRLLQAEQKELDKSTQDVNCLNNQFEVYVPQYNESTGMYGWIPRSDIMNFKKWLKSKTRQNSLSKYAEKENR